MTKEIIYKYLGTNGTLETPIHLEGIYSIKYYDLKADNGQVLTNGEKKCFHIRVPETELNDWHEIPLGQK